jgi:iron complex outermembrane receptor protein
VIADVNAIAAAAGLPLDATFKLEKTLPRVSVEWDAADWVMLYATAAAGARNGNLNPFSSALRGAGTPPNAAAFAAARAFRDDGVVSYEAGVKSQWLDRRATFNLAGYYTRFDDPQIVTSNPFVLTVNGPDEDLYGVEVQSAWRATDQLSLYFNAGWQHAEFIEGARLANPAVLTPLGVTEDLRAGARPVNTPEWQMAVGADFRQPSGWSGIEFVGAASYQYVGSRYSTVQNFPSSALGEQQFVNLRLGLEGPAWALIAFVDNATNEIEYQAVQGNAGTPYLNAAGALDFRPTSVAVNRPRQVGLELRLQY